MRYAIRFPPLSVHVFSIPSNLRDPFFVHPSNETRQAYPRSGPRARRAGACMQARSHVYLSRVGLCGRCSEGMGHPARIRDAPIQRPWRRGQRARVQLSVRSLVGRSGAKNATHHGISRHPNSYFRPFGCCGTRRRGFEARGCSRGSCVCPAWAGRLSRWEVAGLWWARLGGAHLGHLIRGVPGEEE